MTRVTLALVFSTFTSIAIASTSDHWSANVYLENDLFGGTDQNYTNGLRVSLISPNLSAFSGDDAVPSPINTVAARLDKLLGFKQGLSRNIVVSFGQLIYTPQDKTATAVVPNDRPYAGYTYLGLGFHSRTDTRLDSVEVNVGIVGPSAQGEGAQDTVHDLRGFDKFDGWDNQLRDEPTLQFVYERKDKLFAAKSIRGALQHDFVRHIGAAVGNVDVYANVGAEYRIGWHLPEDFGTSAVRPGGDNSAPGAGDSRFAQSLSRIKGFHFFTALDARAVAHDIFLDGNNFKASHSVAKEPVVAEMSVGASVLLQGWKLSYAHVFQTKQFKQQKRHHEYGSLSVSYSF